MLFIFYPHFKKISINVQKVFLLFLCFGCSGHEKSEQERLREQNAKGEYVYRNHDERQYPLKTPTHRDPEPYPWEIETASK
ncbi:MAG: hypothetical protein KBA81_00355 [Rhabdochlamydiaceae bacterium]|nr:hypothetical protein [Rhabdochlamydiaceae bacterium]